MVITNKVQATDTQGSMAYLGLSFLVLAFLSLKSYQIPGRRQRRFNNFAKSPVGL